MQHGAKHGLTLAVHAIGDKANALTLQAFASLDKVPPGSSIEHAQASPIPFRAMIQS